MPTSIYESAVMSVPCRFCKAGVGEPCQYLCNADSIRPPHHTRIGDYYRSDPTPVYPPEKPWETDAYRRIKSSLAGVHLSPEHAADLKRMIDAQTILPVVNAQPQEGMDGL